MTSSTADAVGSTFAHEALLYRGDSEYATGVVPYISTGLAAAEPVAVLVPARRLDLLRVELGPVPATDLRLLDMTEVGRNPGRLIAAVLRTFADAHPGHQIRVVVESLWPERSAAEYTACVQHEGLVNRAFAGRCAAMLCPYDAARLTPAALADAAITHPVIIDGAGRHTSDRFAPEHAIAAGNVPLPPPDDPEPFTVDQPDMSGLRHRSVVFATAHGLNTDRAHDLALALTELACNSIEHAGAAATVLLGTRGSRVVCQVRDPGHLTDPLVGRRPAPPEQLRGRGLLLVHQLADLVLMHTTPGGTTVEVQFEVGG
ncbi:MAG TPA: anti-sigma factor RsbA family regulatory protein [Pseudonocardiaceae bacterium]|jgi:anti-sigma regulatory factor (Ser/Thr protein kinase)|nr:anti-sigma factor RsbA family regulatory protein [Pseudonocardiaceae bacterium]